MYDPNPQLIEQYRQLYEKGNFWGSSILKHVYEISKLVRETDSCTLLDYGCGAGNQYADAGCHLYWGGILPALYDPAISRYSERPMGRFDGIICSDVAEHIPEEEIDDFLKDVFNYAAKFVFFSICCRPARKSLPDGRNCHLTIQPQDWWIRRIDEASNKRIDMAIRIAWNP